MTCRACGQPHGCDHSDAEYQGVVPPRLIIFGIDLSSRPDMSAEVTYAADGTIANIELDPKR
ncbi:hypothetical protein [Sphingopyxis macrogoltabida]|uniref:Uncharacterized protein n=1 Tax=Sphingopyxis macrogoltabida TaxID=33050 RepID=A0AAC9FFR7_SPHMC|nr:hypothetical protein [Sphingopyxis macrogoltabida]ALJ14090.1 hypothetical protein LH19_14545 [Sphingopyxis macrogoltabida]AMU90361.1 hypothetical protein ATM17_15145 [Sphingopyxis macrogoltabida]